jgi:hypothetical protein
MLDGRDIEAPAHPIFPSVEQAREWLEARAK